MLLDSAHMLEKYKIPYMIHEGTTLGACRDKDIFPSDTDADILLPPEFMFQQQTEMQKELCKVGNLELKEGTDYVLWPAGTNELSKTTLGQIWICLKHAQCKVPSVDYHNNEGDEIKTGHDGVSGASKGDLAYNFWKDTQFWPPVKDKQACNIPNPQNFVFPVPNNPEVFLEHVYGPTWQSHRQHFAIRACELGMRYIIPLFCLVHVVLVPFWLWAMQRSKGDGYAAECTSRKDFSWDSWKVAWIVHLIAFAVTLVVLGWILFVVLKRENPYKFKRIVLGESEYNF